MQYRIKSVRVKNFKCFDSSKYYEFILDVTKNPIILTGPNGFGKTTFFDAIELLFSKKITRFNISIENKNTDLQKNVLLNEANYDGYIICTLMNERRECLSLIAKIDHRMHKVSYTESIYYGVKHGNIITEKLDETIQNYTDWRGSVIEFNEIKYSEGNFNVYYYVSQAESVHFLKQSITARKDAMNTLLDLGDVEKWGTFLQNSLIGKNASSSGVLINDEIKSLDELIDKDVKKLKELGNIEETVDKADFFHIIELEDSECFPAWDCENLEGLSTEELEKGLQDIDRLSQFIEDFEDYKNLLWNKKFDSAITNGIEDFILIRRYVVDEKIDLNTINKAIESQNRIVEIFNNSAFLRGKDVIPEEYSVEGMIKLKQLFPDGVLFDIKEVERICNKLKDIGKTLSSKQTVIKKLEDAREELQEANNSYDEKGDRCPYCGQPYGESQKLKEAYDAARDLLEAEKGEELNGYNEIKKHLKEIIKDSQAAISKEIGRFDEKSINELLKEISNVSTFISDKKRVEDVELLIPFINVDLAFEDMGKTEQRNELQRILIAAKKTYQNGAFTTNFDTYEYSKLVKEYPNIEWDKQKLLLDRGNINSKKSYIKSAINSKNNKKAYEIKICLKENIKKWQSLKAVRNDLKYVQKIYSEAIDEYKNQVMKGLRVPLLIYTGKILQDYQNGLGVFISKDEMRFVTNGDVKHDILNTFSSGQLSGFVLAFLFSMNKQYVKASEDDLGFILIDDPVQTMDDINISSMIEVLRNDFKDRQIILSTHETDKENYILYKFFKYNRIGQAFNVKDQLYGI